MYWHSPKHFHWQTVTDWYWSMRWHLMRLMY